MKEAVLMSKCFFGEKDIVYTDWNFFVFDDRKYLPRCSGLYVFHGWEWSSRRDGSCIVEDYVTLYVGKSESSIYSRVASHNKIKDTTDWINKEPNHPLADHRTANIHWLFLPSGAPWQRRELCSAEAVMIQEHQPLFNIFHMKAA